jgi:hypothetical protein
MKPSIVLAASWFIGAGAGAAGAGAGGGAGEAAGACGASGLATPIMVIAAGLAGGGAGWGGGAPTTVPHCPQNFAFSGSGFPHVGQAAIFEGDNITRAFGAGSR